MRIHVCMRHVPSISQEAGETWTLRVAFASSAEGGCQEGRGGRAEDIFLGSQVGGVYYDATLRVRDLLSTQENWYQVRMRL